MAKQEYLYPKAPEKDKDGNLVADEVVKFCKNILELFKDKVSKDNKNNEEMDDSTGSGLWYVQYPSVASNDEDTAFPEAERPASLFGGTWTEMWVGEGVVFQTAEVTDHYPRTDGLMVDHFQDHYVRTWSSRYDTSGGSTGTYTAGNAVDTYWGSYWAYYSGAQQFVAKAGGTPRYGSRTAHRNRLFKVWYRES